MGLRRTLVGPPLGLIAVRVGPDGSWGFLSFLGPRVETSLDGFPVTSYPGSRCVDVPRTARRAKLPSWSSAPPGIEEILVRWGITTTTPVCLEGTPSRSVTPPHRRYVVSTVPVGITVPGQGSGLVGAVGDS